MDLARKADDSTTPKPWWLGTALRLVLPSALTIALYWLAIFFFILPAFENTVMDRKREMIEELTRIGQETLIHFEGLVESGKLTKTEAQKQAIDQLRSFRYGRDGKDYFWINDLGPRIVMHPYRPDLEGKDVSDYADPTGKHLFVEVVQEVKKHGAGFVDYMWQWMDDPKNVVPKVSHVREFKPWGWIIGTGIYVEDVRAEMEKLSRRLTSISLGILAVIALLSVYVIGQNIRAQVKRLKAEEDLQSSQRMLRLVMDNIPQQIYWKGSTGTYWGCNRAFAIEAGLEDTSDVAGKSDYGLAWPEGYPKYQGEKEREVMDTGVALTRVVEPLANGEGGNRWFEVSRLPLSDGRGRVIGLLGVKHDITEQRMTMEALLESERRFRTLVESAQVGIFILQKDIVVYMNPEQRRLFGKVPEPFDLGQFLDAPEEDLDKLARLTSRQWPEDRKSLELEIRLFPHGEMNKGGKMRWVQCRANAITYGRRQAILVVMLDITKAKELEHLLMVQDKMASLGRVAAGMAHEIRNPLSGINLYLTALEETFLHAVQSSEDLEQLERIFTNLKNASQKIETVVKRVLDFSKPTRPQLQWAPVNPIIESVLEFSAVTFRKSGIKVEKSLAPNLPLCRIDSQLIEQVLMNLVTNAIQVLKNQDKARTIAVSSFVERDQVVIRISDSGPGVPPEIRSRIFDPFFSLNKDGSGIGLSLSHRIVSDHGGTLTMQPSHYGGAEFIVSLPALFPIYYDSVG